MRWAREELNLRPLPCQLTRAYRCATRRSPRSRSTVDAEGKRSLDVKGNALFRHFDAATAARVAPPPALTSHCMRPSTASMHRPRPDPRSRSPSRPAARIKVTTTPLPEASVTPTGRPDSLKRSVLGDLLADPSSEERVLGVAAAWMGPSAQDDGDDDGAIRLGEQVARRRLVNRLARQHRRRPGSRSPDN